MNEIEALIHRRAIEDALVSYCRYLDRMDLCALAQLFTGDCSVSFGPDPRLAADGRAALETSLSRMWRWRRTAHHLSNVSVQFVSDSAADAESAVWAWHEAEDGTDAEIFGVYRDRLVRQDGAWLIANRRMEMTGSRGGFRVPVPAAFRAPPPPGWSAPEGLDG